jgi:hypothetical protein
MTDRRIVHSDTFHKWVVSGIATLTLAAGIMGYYIKAEDNETRALLQAQISILQEQQKTAVRVNQLVIIIDKKLSNIENNLKRQSTLILEVRELRKEVNNLKVEIAKATKHG